MSSTHPNADAFRFRRFDREVRVPNSLVKLHLIDVRSALIRAIHTAHEDLHELATDQELGREVDRLIGEAAEYLQILHHLSQMAGDPRTRRVRR